MSVARCARQWPHSSGASRNTQTGVYRGAGSRRRRLRSARRNAWASGDSRRPSCSRGLDSSECPRFSPQPRAPPSVRTRKLRCGFSRRAVSEGLTGEGWAKVTFSVAFPVQILLFICINGAAGAALASRPMAARSVGCFLFAKFPPGPVPFQAVLAIFASGCCISDAFQLPRGA